MTSEELLKLFELNKLSIKNALTEEVDLSDLIKEDTFKNFALSFHVSEEYYNDYPNTIPERMLMVKIDDRPKEPDYGHGASYGGHVYLAHGKTKPGRGRVAKDLVYYIVETIPYDDSEDTINHIAFEDYHARVFKTVDEVIEFLKENITNWIDVIVPYKNGRKRYIDVNHWEKLFTEEEMGSYESKSN